MMTEKENNEFLLNFISLQEKSLILEVRVAILEEMLFKNLSLNKEEYVSKCNSAIKIVNDKLQETLLKSDKVKKIIDKLENEGDKKEKEGA